MIKITIRFKDGFSSTTPYLRGVVMQAQKGLVQTGKDVDIDGYYGNQCVTAVKQFQEASYLPVTGELHRADWDALEPHIREAEKTLLETMQELLPAFHGDLAFIHLLEGHRGKPYWPGGHSGVTLDPGVDLGYADHFFVQRFYKEMMSDEQWAAILKVFGKHGGEAKNALDADEVLHDIRISKAQADGAMPYALSPYWLEISERFPSLEDPDTPASVQTVLLSLAYNRGAANKHLGVLAEPLAAGQWAEVADMVAGMQQDHQLEGIQKRRRWEGALIKAELESA